MTILKNEYGRHDCTDRQYHRCWSYMIDTYIAIPFSLNYLIQVLLEVLRLYPPVFGFTKEAMKGGIKLPVGDYFIPEETILLVS